jgi:acetyl esterase/lipase
MRAHTLLLSTLACGLCIAAAPTPSAQPAPAMPGPSMFTMTPAVALPEANAILLTAVHEHSTEIWNQIPGSRIVRNVVNPALIPFPAKAGVATGAAVIIAPGGGFKFLSMDSEGYDVAKWLAARGVTCFVLKYRTESTPVDLAEFQKALASMFAGARNVAKALPGEERAVEDGLAAVRYVRSHAAEWQVDANRVGFMGFSAGGMTTSGVATRYDAASRPAFAGIIYGAMKTDAVIPADAPPAFILVAADDPLLANASYPIFKAWTDAHHKAELHVLQSGGHGFGMKPTNASVDHWIDAFYWWLQNNGLLKASAPVTGAAAVRSQ